MKITNIHLYIVVLVLGLVSCSGKRVIPDDKLANILYEMYIKDAVLVGQGLSDYQDSIRIYEPITEKYGYSVTDLNNTMSLYASKGGRLQAVYDRVSDLMIAEKMEYESEARVEKLSQNQFKGTDSMVINSTIFNERNFNLQLDEIGVYYISADYLFFKDDSTKNPKMGAWLAWRQNSDSIAGKQEVSIIKDTLYNTYTVRIVFDNPDYNQLKGYWLNFDKKELPLKKENTESVSIAVSLKQKITKTKKEPLLKQNLKIKGLSIQYNFAESDSLRVTNFMKSFLGGGNTPTLLLVLQRIRQKYRQILQKVQIRQKYRRIRQKDQIRQKYRQIRQKYRRLVLMN